MKLIVGLGNPGKEYKLTRHNVGFMVVEELARRLGVQKETARFEAVLAQTQLQAEKLLLAKPLTFMNLSGKAVAGIMRWYKLAPEDLLIVYDDMDLPEGAVRLRAQGGTGGHNGMKSIVASLATQDFSRIRIGIGRSDLPTVPHVLGKFSKTELPVIEAAVTKAADAAECWVIHGINQAMNTYN